MSLILTIDTSTRHLSIAIQDKSELIDCIILDDSLQHAKLVTVEIKKILDRNKIDLNQLAAIAINEGPGSFTGLRVGSSIAKGLCFGLDIPLISIRGLETYGLFFYSYFKAKVEDVFVLLDARRDNYFYTHIKNGSVHQKICFKSWKEISAEIKDAENTWVYKSNEQNELNMEAKYLINAAWSQFNQKQFEELANYEPNYYINNYITK